MSESRKLAAILAADVVGYSRLASADEDRILARLRALRSDLIDPTIAVHHGRVVKRTGDGALVEFRSVVDAVRCAIEVQNAMVERNAGVPPDRRIEFRIGIHIGDVVEESDGDLMGDGINIAARLEAIAAPGAICLSEDAYRQVRSRLDVFVSDLGQTRLKNIAEPVRIYSLEVGGRTVAPVALPAASPAAPVELPQKPSIAVLPFTNMSGDPEQEYFGDGVTEDIITELSRFRSLFVIARNSSFQFRDKAADMKRVGRELGVQYVVEGSIRRSGEKLRVTAQLIETATGTHIWAERYDRDVRDIFDLQDELAHAVAATVGGRVDMAGRERSARLSPAGLKAYDFHLRAKASYLEFAKAGNERARTLAKEAIGLDPTNAVITAYYAHYCFLDYNFGWVLDADQSLRSALQFGKQAVTLDDADSTARWVLSLVYLMMRNYDEARVHIEKALELNPNDTEARGIYGDFLTYVGEPEKGLEQFEIAKRHNPFDMSWLPWVKGTAYFTARRYAEAINTFNQIHNPNHEINYWLAASYGHAGRFDEARAKLREFLRIAKRDMAQFPDRNSQAWMTFFDRSIPYKDRRNLDHLCDGLRKAGLPL